MTKTKCWSCNSIALQMDDYPERVTTAKYHVERGTQQPVDVCARHFKALLDHLLKNGQTATLSITKLR